MSIIALQGTKYKPPTTPPPQATPGMTPNQMALLQAEQNRYQQQVSGWQRQQGFVQQQTAKLGPLPMAGSSGAGTGTTAAGGPQAMPATMTPGQPAPAAATATPTPQGLPPTGLQAQLNSLQSMYGQVQNMALNPQGGGGRGHIGFNVATNQNIVQQQRLAGGGVGGPSPTGGTPPGGQVNIQSLAKNLAQRYGLPMGRGELVDPQGNWLVTPEQLAAASGGSETMGMAAAKMNYISQAISNQQNREQQTKAIAAVSQGYGLVQSRARGSLAAMQSPFLQDIADLYANQEHEAADFTFFIEEERMRIQQELSRRAEKRAKKAARANTIVGIAGLVLAPFTGGATLGLAAGLTSAGETGWF